MDGSTRNYGEGIDDIDDAFERIMNEGEIALKVLRGDIKVVVDKMIATINTEEGDNSEILQCVNNLMNGGLVYASRRLGVSNQEDELYEPARDSIVGEILKKGYTNKVELVNLADQVRRLVEGLESGTTSNME